MQNVTKIIDQIRSGSEEASASLLPVIYEELRRLAASRMKGERADHTLTPTALVHEAYLRLTGNEPSDWNGRAHFFAAASEAMRRILIDHARGKNAIKRGGDLKRLNLVESWLEHEKTSEELIELDEALGELESQDKEAATLVKLRFFAGMTIKEAAESMQLSPRKANMLWAYARSWLKRAMTKFDETSY